MDIVYGEMRIHHLIHRFPLKSHKYIALSGFSFFFALVPWHFSLSFVCSTAISIVLSSLLFHCANFLLYLNFWISRFHFRSIHIRCRAHKTLDCCNNTTQKNARCQSGLMKESLFCRSVTTQNKTLEFFGLQFSSSFVQLVFFFV